MGRTFRVIIITGGILLAVLFVLSLFGGFSGGYWGWGRTGCWGFINPWGMGGFGMPFMGVFMVLFWGLVIWAAVALIRGISHGRIESTYPPSDSSLEVLKRRYARGDISREEYEEKKKDLI